MHLDRGQQALLDLGRALRDQGYTFVTPTPETHRRVLARDVPARTLRDVFGWSRPFAPDVLPRELRALLESAGALEQVGDRLRAGVRFSSVGAHLFVHSAFPTVAADAVFFGPDTYRFCAFVERSVGRARRIVDVGCGTGAGGLVAALRTQASDVVLADVNRAALRLTAVNAWLADRPDARIVQSDVLRSVEGDFDLVVANPPYLVDEGARVYRDGGGLLGAELSVRIARESLGRLRPGGGLLLYTGTAIVEGEDVFRRAIAPALEGFAVSYEELDPDVFGEELDRPAYATADRIAVVGLTARRV